MDSCGKKDVSGRFYTNTETSGALQDFHKDSARTNIGTATSTKFLAVVADCEFYSNKGLTWWDRYFATCERLGVVWNTKHTAGPGAQGAVMHVGYSIVSLLFNKVKSSLT